MANATSTIQFVVPGQREGVQRGNGVTARLGFAGGQIKHSVRLGALRAGNEKQVLDAVPGEDFVVLQLTHGPSLVLHPETARDLLAAQAGARVPSRGAAEGPPTSQDKEIECPVALSWAGLGGASPTRGGGGIVGDVLPSAFQIITGKAFDLAADLIVRQVRDAVDDHVPPGLYLLRPDSLLRPARSEPALPENKTFLVLVHGTFVDTASTFASLWAMHSQRVADLFSRYEGRVYGFDHPTLGVSPIVNALRLAEALPKGARLHLLTHSRGGLVAEVLARVCGRPVTDHEAGAAFGESAPPSADAANDDRTSLLELSRIVREKGIRVDRMVRVACPAHGTTLASKRLDAYLSVFKWLLELAKIPVLPSLVDLLSQVALHGIDPSTMPGLAAMTPNSPLLTWLSQSDGAIPGDLRVVAGDMRGDSLVSWLKTLVSDAFFWTDNDLVVQTRSMYGGTPRDAGAGFVLDAGSKVNHFNYFANESTVQGVVAGLTQDAPQAYRPIGPLSWAGTDASGTRAGRPDAALDVLNARLPAVFILPGILGTNLKVGDHRIWLGPRLVGGFPKLAYQSRGADGVLPDAPLAAYYDKLATFLSSSNEVISFGFDWRRPLEEEAVRLADQVEAALDRRNASGQPVRLLAHSMGGLLARIMFLERPETWKRMMDRDGARLVMLGTPNAGSWAPMKVLSGDDGFGNLLAFVGEPFGEKAARQEMADMPGLVQLQAGLADGSNRLDTQTAWKKLADEDLDFVGKHSIWHRVAWKLGVYDWGLPKQQVLDRAVALRRRLDEQKKGALTEYTSKMALVVGQAKLTPDDYVMTDEGLRYLEVPEDGDGTVTYASALLPDVATWKVDCAHGDLPAHEASFEAYGELLKQGRTIRLATLAECVGRGGEPARALPARTRVLRRPSRSASSFVPPETPRDLFSVAAAVAAVDAAKPTTPQALRVTVQNGNLKFVRQPLLVGHYRSLRLTGAEHDIDTLIGGTMAESLAAGQYPDAPGSHQVFVNRRVDEENPWQTPQPESVIVVGLGEEGHLRLSTLSLSVMHGILAWSQRMAEASEGAPSGFGVAATLIGSGGVGVTAGSAARAIAQGVRDANDRLVAAKSDWPRATHLLLVELYADRAAEAWQGLTVQAAESGAYQIDECVQLGTGPLRRPLDLDYRGADYDLVSALSEGKVEADDGRIKYTLDTKRARAEIRAQATQSRLLDELIGGKSGLQDSRIGRTLFDLLVPVDLEPFLGGTDQMVLELDTRTAAIPWELLDTRAGTRLTGDRPWAIRTQLVRKLRTATFRVAVSDATADDHVLVIGAPKVDDRQRYPPLPAAINEAKAVQATLTDQGGLGAERVHSLVDEPDAVQILHELHERSYRIVHVAGHGEHGDRGGVVLSGGTFLGWREIESMRVVPELVFINCCHTGAIRPPRPGEPRRGSTALAASAAEALIRVGVRCVVAAGWAVNDDAAKKFAETFYRALLDGKPFAAAVGQARDSAWDRRVAGDDTWAAYQCYGDPQWTFRVGVGAGPGAPRSPVSRFAKLSTSAELQLALETLVMEHRFQGAGERAADESVRHLEARFGPIWGSRGAVAEGFGAAYAEQHDLDNAIRWYEAAFRAEDSQSSMQASEMIGNLRARRAWERLDVAQRKKHPREKLAALVVAGRKEIDDACELLERLRSLKETAERASLCGSAFKRRAMLERVAFDETLTPDTAAESGAIQRMVEHYAKAETLARSHNQPILSYAALNRLAGRYRQDPGTPLLRELDDIEAHVERQIRDAPDFWRMADRVHIRFYRALWSGALKEQVGIVVRGYRELNDRVKTTSLWASVYDQAIFVLTPPANASPPLPEEAAAGRTLEKVLASFAGRDENA